MSEAADKPKEKFAPKQAVTLNPPKDDIIDRQHLAKCNGKLSSSPSADEQLLTPYVGTNEEYPTLVAIKVT